MPWWQSWPFTGLAETFLGGLAVVLWRRTRKWVCSRLVQREARQFFGPLEPESPPVIITLDVYRPLPGGPGYWKGFPEHATTFPGPRQLLGYCSARAATYIETALSGIRGLHTKVLPDEDVTGTWNATFVNIGSSYSNRKTDAMKKDPGNRWLEDDGGRILLKDGQTVVAPTGREVGYILRLRNAARPDHYLFACAGPGEWGTSGAAFFLATKWRELHRRFRDRPFLLLLTVVPEADGSAEEFRVLDH